MARIVVRTVAVVLALAGVVVLVVRPLRGDSHTEARFTVPAPLRVSDAVSAIRTHAPDSAVTVDGRSITVSTSGRRGEEARGVADVTARGGLDAARQQLIAAQTARAHAARADRADAVAQLAILAARTGFTDPEPAYQQKLRDVQRLGQQQAAAESAGLPHADIDSQLANSQQDLFELKLQVTRHAELIETEATALRRESEAKSAIDTATRAAGTAPITVSDDAAAVGWSVALGVALLVIAGVTFLVGMRLPRRAERLPDEIDLREGTTPRYLDFYRKLDPSPSASSDKTGPPPVRIDLVREEALETVDELDSNGAPRRNRSARG